MFASCSMSFYGLSYSTSRSHERAAGGKCAHVHADSTSAVY